MAYLLFAQAGVAQPVIEGIRGWTGNPGNIVVSFGCFLK
jgi:hypothetical protein